VINPAAFTEVDRSEREFELALTVNAEAPGEIARWCAMNGSSLIHYSTDYVYNGQGSEPWDEASATQPINKYGASKLAGEEAVRASGCHHLVLRTSWVYSGVGKNFLLTMLKLGREREVLKIVGDQIGAPTYAGDLAEATLKIARHEKFQEHSGIFHVVNAGETSWYGFALAIFEEMRRRGQELKLREVLEIPSSEYPLPAPRPHNSRLRGDKLFAAFGVQLRDWRSALTSCMIEIKF
jgi:dTDP-4-dehydrorhamnose reductase